MKACLLFLLICGFRIAVGDYTLAIRVHYPDSNLHGSTISLRGNGAGLTWKSGKFLQKNSSIPNLWETTLSHNSPGITLEMKTLLKDSTWQIGSNERVVLPSRSAAVDIYPWFTSAKGKVSYIRKVYSPQFQNTRDLVLYTPPSYYENTLKTIKNVLVRE